MGLWMGLVNKVRDAIWRRRRNEEETKMQGGGIVSTVIRMDVESTDGIVGCWLIDGMHFISSINNRF
jgi:hypothetical protein